MEAHKQAIAKVAASVRYFFKRNEPYRIFHGSTNSTRPCQRNKTVDISTLSNVLEADVKAPSRTNRTNGPPSGIYSQVQPYSACGYGISWDHCWRWFCGYQR